MAEPGESPLAPLVPPFLPKGRKCKVNNVAAEPPAGVELGPEIVITELCLMPG